MEVQPAPRYPLHGRVQVALPNQTVITGHSLDISVGGICILLGEPISLGTTHLLRFEMHVNGKTHIIVAQARPVYGVFANRNGFRVGFAFTEDDPQRTAAINLLAGKKPMVDATSKEALSSVGQGQAD